MSRYTKTETAFDKPKSYVVYDLETTGLTDPIFPIQYGAMKVIDGQVVDRFYTKVALPDGVKIESGAIEKHGIYDRELEGAPSQEKAYAAFSSFVGDLPLVSYNGMHYDDPIINCIADALGMPHLTENRGSKGEREVDVMQLYMGVVGRRRSLANACAYYGVENQHEHDAMGDVQATQEVYEMMLGDIRRKSTDPRDIDVARMSDELEGELVCVSGGTEKEKRQYERLAKSMGANLYNNVTKKVTLCVLLNGTDTGKATKAHTYGIPVLKGKEFLAKYGKDEDDLEAADSLFGIWESDMDEELRNSLHRELGLPIKKKELVWARAEDSWLTGRNKWGYAGPTFSPRYVTEPVADIRVSKRYKDGTVLLDVKMPDGSVHARPVNADYFATMQSEYKFMSAMEAKDEDEGEDE